jgi:hypothetical protein
MNELFTTKNRFAFRRKFFISAKLVHGIADNSEHIIITIGRRLTAFAEKGMTLA